MVIDGDCAEVTHGKIRAVASLDRGEAIPEVHLAFFDATTGKELLREERQHFWAPGARVHLGDRAGDYELHQQFAAYDDELLFGIGQRTHGRLNLKGLGLDLIQRNGEVNIPFVLSSRGYGLLWNRPAVGQVELGVTGTRWRAGHARQIDYWITAGGPRPPSSRRTLTRRVTSRTCRRGQAASGSRNCDTAPRKNCSKSRASLPAATCRCR